jgi:hypothetical protein
MRKERLKERIEFLKKIDDFQDEKLTGSNGDYSDRIE